MNSLQSAYSPFKLVHHPEKIAELRSRLQTVPLHAQLVISDYCNHDCNFCGFRMRGNPNNELFAEVVDGIRQDNPRRFMPTSKALDVIDDFRQMGVRAVQFTGGGEPTAHPQHQLIFEHALNSFLECALITNGYSLSDHTIRSLESFQWVRFSVDAGRAQTYSAIRRLPHKAFETTWRNIGRTVAARRAYREKSGMSGPVLSVGFVVTRENYQEIDEAASLARHAGVDSIRLSAAFTPDRVAYFREIYDNANRGAKRAVEDHATEDFAVHNLFNARLDDLQHQHPEYKSCGYQQLTTFIGADQNVYRCCNTAYSQRGLLGSIKHQRFVDFWTSAEKEQRIRQFDARECGSCMFNAQNRFINYCLDPDPVHTNFL